MKKDLPRVFANTIDKKINNTQEIFYENQSSSEKKSLNEIIRTINEIFNSPNHVYKSTCYITINGVEEKKVIVGKNANSLFTLEGDVINIREIEDIKKRI